MSFWEYERLAHATHEWEQIQHDEPLEKKDAAGNKVEPPKTFNQPLSPDYGPQFVKLGDE